MSLRRHVRKLALRKFPCPSRPDTARGFVVDAFCYKKIASQSSSPGWAVAVALESSTAVQIMGPVLLGCLEPVLRQYLPLNVALIVYVDSRIDFLRKVTDQCGAVGRREAFSSRWSETNGYIFSPSPPHLGRQPSSMGARPAEPTGHLALVTCY
ncbi:hypothetical protein EVAR_68507_1 [Eumeta japonica]|uniref:Uncharacterized protein n=1 Tax=Eumeta variegata TaxID=151549 RepID=A0A4C2A5W1_EUMVA|nr:hypothetical protein EVAR_68507_1 [Eumeta japonica]